MGDQAMNGRRCWSLGSFPTVLALAMLVLPINAFADGEGWYVTGKAGGTRLLKSDVSGSATSGDASFDDGPVGLVGVGYGFGSFRAEGELGYRENDLKSFTGGTGTASGEARAWSLMANGFYDIDVGGSVKPYVGAGVGVARIDLDGISQGGTALADDRDDVLAFQAMAGLRVPLSDSLSADLGYRFLATQNPTFTSVGGTGFSGRYRSHAVTVGLTWQFGAPAKPAAQPAAPPPAPAAPAPKAQPAPAPKPAPAAKAPPAPVRNFLVFFDWDRSDIRPDAMPILVNAVESAAKLGVTRIHLVGHADRSGSRRYNQGLSERRARSVRDFLVGRNIPAAIITTEGRGEDEPLVATPDGVREQQNRRVEIRLP